jgi:GTP pyrophosphokinase
LSTNEHPSRGDSPNVDDAFIESLASHWRGSDADIVREAARTAMGSAALADACAVAGILAELHMDHETAAAALLMAAPESLRGDERKLKERFGASVVRLLTGLERLELVGETHGRAADSNQGERLRSLLLALVDDVRVVVIKLAERLHAMRGLKHQPEEVRTAVARQTRDIYAPLANRLGVWRVKWELEDLTLRYLEPDTYKEIARLLDERRVDRESYIEQVVSSLRRELARAGVHGEVNGRPKHIYSIWRKMQRKGVDFHQLFDVRAVRILVDDVAACYAALGLVHTLWQPVPREFDDYIANPKPNLYQSLHTAVIGPGGKTLEVQIRTYDMHQHSELGVAAHWRYKEGGKADPALEQKVLFLRNLLADEAQAEGGDLVDLYRTSAFGDRVYVITPKGTVLDLPQGSTPLDFAYAIHTEVGHRCRGAKVDGRMVPLTYPLRNGEQVEVLTASNGNPSRDWLNPSLGYLKSASARAKVRAWFKHQDHDQNLMDGRAILEREFKRLRVEPDLERLVKRFRVASVEDLYVAVGRGDITSGQITSALQDAILPPKPKPEERLPRAPRKPKKGKTGGSVSIRGVGNLMTHISQCCKPVLGDSIIGFITQGRGVAIHRQDCGNILNLDDASRARLVEVEWDSGGDGGEGVYSVDIRIEAHDRQGLLRDVTLVLAEEKVNVIAMNTHTDRHQHRARLDLHMEISDVEQLTRVLDKINQLPNVMDARRLG